MRLKRDYPLMPKFPFAETFHPEKALSIGLKGSVPAILDSDEVRKLKTISSAFQDFYQPESPLDFLWLQILSMSFFKLQKCWGVSIDDKDLSRGDVIKLETQLISQIEKSTRKLEISLGRRLKPLAKPSESITVPLEIPKGGIPPEPTREELDRQIQEVREAIPLITSALDQLAKLPEGKKLGRDLLLEGFKHNNFIYEYAKSYRWKLLDRDEQKTALEEILKNSKSLLERHPKTSNETFGTILENLEKVSSK
jgi:hypothetical protein